MSRIIVKNLPKNINENDIKKHFSVKGDVTDVKIMKKENGKSRNFCFVGFRDLLLILCDGFLDVYAQDSTLVDHS